MSTKDDIKEFYDDSPHRGLGIALPTILENRVAVILKSVMRPDSAIEGELFRASGALGAFGTKIRLAYLLGLIAKETYSDLNTLVRIRNLFAHDVGIKSFDDERISSRIKNMHVYKTLISLKNTHPFDPHKDEPSNEKLKAQILRDEMETMRDSFRMCVRMLIHDLNRSDEPRRSRADTDDPRGSTGT